MLYVSSQKLSGLTDFQVYNHVMPWELVGAGRTQRRRKTFHVPEQRVMAHIVSTSNYCSRAGKHEIFLWVRTRNTHFWIHVDPYYPGS